MSETLQDINIYLKELLILSQYSLKKYFHTLKV